MLNKTTLKLLDELKPKLFTAESADEVKEIVCKAGGEISAEDAEKLFAEIKENKAESGAELDDDEMDAVAGGAWGRIIRNWLTEGCAATCEPDSGCWSNDQCRACEYEYTQFWETCPDGTPHNMEIVGDDFFSTTPVNVYKCSKCSYSYKK